MNFFVDNSKLPILVAAGVGILTVSGCYYWYRRYQYHYVPPKQWRKVGELSDIICYPIKSCGPVRVNTVNCSKLGLSDGHLRDRVFMVIQTKNGRFVTARQYPQMVKIQPKIKGSVMTLSAPGMRDVEVDFERLYKTKHIKCSVWDQPVDAVDCGEDVARWFSRYILEDDFGLRLVFYAKELSMRDVRTNNKCVDTTLKEDTGAFHDATSFMILNESSLNDLNTRLSLPVMGLNFRPNFVVKGGFAYEEDFWRWVKIGEVVFRCVKPCTR